MKCPECEKLGLTSKLFINDTFTTCIGWRPFYDEKGELHHHNPNHVNHRLQCSEGHVTTNEIPQQCWCGWSNKK